MQRERLTITLDSQLLAAIDTLIDRQTLRNRSQTIEHLLKEGLSLHELRQAFLFVETSWSQEALLGILARLHETGITEIFLTLPAGEPALAQAVQLAAHDFFARHSEIRLVPVPGDFGSGGAVVLQQDRLRHPFFLAWIGGAAPAVPALVPLYAFHRQHHQPLTLALPSGAELATVPLAIASPELAASIPTGVVSLRRSVFPNLVKEGKVRGYPIP